MWCFGARVRTRASTRTHDPPLRALNGVCNVICCFNLPFDRFEYCSVVIIVVGAAISKHSKHGKTENEKYSMYIHIKKKKSTFICIIIDCVFGIEFQFDVLFIAY